MLEAINYNFTNIPFLIQKNKGNCQACEKIIKRQKLASCILEGLLSTSRESHVFQEVLCHKI